MIFSAIAAMASNRVIGTAGDLPWNIPEDFKFFKDKTMGHMMIMGRKTFDSFGGKPLPGRLHLVITRQKNYVQAGTEIFNSIEDAVQFCTCKAQTAKWGEEVFIIGGGEIYKSMLPLTDRIYLTEIHRDFPGDTRFPEFDKSIFQEVERIPKPGPIPFDFVTYQRQKR